MMCTILLVAANVMSLAQSFTPNNSNNNNNIHHIHHNSINQRCDSSVTAAWAVKVQSDEKEVTATASVTAAPSSMPSFDLSEANAAPTPTTTTDTTTTPKKAATKPERSLDVSSQIDLPFPAELAYDSFSDLTRQPEWSPWLHKVEYVEGDDDEANEDDAPSAATKWTLKVLGVTYSWISVATRQDRPYLLEWESVSGLKNFGKVEFTPLFDNDNDSEGNNVSSSTSTTCRMTMSMTFVPPRLVAAFFRNKPNNKDSSSSGNGSGGGLQRFMERKLIGSSLQSFRDVIIDTVLGRADNATLFFPI